MTSTDESNLITAGMAATTCSPKSNAGQMTGPAACAVRVRSALIPATLSARCSKAMIAGSPVAAASHDTPNGLDRLALASAGQGTSCQDPRPLLPAAEELMRPASNLSAGGRSGCA